MYRAMRTSFNAVRSDDNPNDMVIEGYFILYEVETELYPGCLEIISRGACDESVAKNDVRALWNHNTQFVIGRKKALTLEIKCDEKGVWARIKLPNTSYARDLYELVKRGDVDQCSFGFDIEIEDYEILANDNIRWRIAKADVWEVSIVTFPAYENTSVEARKKDFELIKKRSIESKKAILQKRLEGKKC